ncbi:glycosyltransferase family 4 protein [Microbacterium rhizomatis]|uniref:Glycosyltransferase family 4 protein n=1 Tax=Microbacterium rhizomatis TaxID=1631477 RepID=A0A5J5J1X7_9MICO|nr:glycosyltransferase family 1 protein [Microbacterium rhizomatis]KAA9108377.1 glycosyltransferase family 4 protein [Microbacterium rhizomatis]
MRLFFDARYIRTDFHDGISRFSHELAHAVARAAPSTDAEVTFLVHDDAQVAMLPSGSPYRKIHAPTSVKEPFTALLLNRWHPDVVYTPMQTMGTAGRRFRVILTLHDTIYYRHRTPPRDLSWLLRVGWRLFHLSYLPQRLVLNAADVVATVSRTSRRQFADARLTKREVVVIPNAPQRLAELLPPGSATPGADAPANIVYMGAFLPYKNVETVIRAMQWLPGRTLHLLSRISAVREGELRKLVPDGAVVQFHNGVSDELYAQLLADAGVLVSASLDEGYGLPLAEALALGAPAVVSDLEIFREVAGDGALFVPAMDAGAFAAAVRSLDDAETRRALTTAGRAHIARFTWDRSADILLGVVRGLA